MNRSKPVLAAALALFLALLVPGASSAWVHLELRLRRRRRCVPGAGRALLQHRRPDRNRRLQQRFAPTRHQSRSQRREPTGDDGLQLVVPGFGGPTGVGAAGELGATVYSYGNSSLRVGITKLSPKQGVVIQNEGNGWSHVVATLTPGIPGDSGSGFVNGSGAAIGVLSALQLAPLPATNGVGDLAKEIAYARASGFSGLGLVPGTEPFKPNLVGAILGS